MVDEVDVAAERIEADRQSGVARVSARLAGDGRDDCETCGDLIEADRRRALPSARTCHGCQEAAERMRRLFPGSAFRRGV